MSGTAQIFLDIKNRLEAVNPAVAYPVKFVPSKTGKFVYLWNKTTARLKKGNYAGIQPPFIFIELKDSIPVGQWMNGSRDFDLTIRVHIVHKFFNSTDGLVAFDQDLMIFDFKDWVFMMLEQFQPTQCGTMNLVSEDPDNDHDMLVEYTQDYKLRFTNSLVDQPIGALAMNDTTTSDVTMTIATEQ